MPKIITNKAYFELKSDAQVYQDMYNQDITTLMLDNKDYELKINEINNRLKDILQLKSKTSKDKIINRIKEVIRFIERGK